MIELIALDDGRGRIHNCVVQGAPGAGIYVETDERTTVKITDRLASDCADNGFYCSSGSGRVVIENSTAIDNDISNIRLGGTVRDSMVFVSDSELANARGTGSGTGVVGSKTVSGTTTPTTRGPWSRSHRPPGR